MERPGIEPPLCATSTNRRLYAIYSQIPVDNCASLHRRMTEATFNSLDFVERTRIDPDAERNRPPSMLLRIGRDLPWR
jgi:hypothetical protein